MSASFGDTSQGIACAIFEDVQTLYLKYRPQNVSELGLTSVRDTLGKYLAGDKMPHAWLFSGSRGTGKTSSARILAKYLNCTSQKDKPCNECSMCLAVTAGSAVDVLEIDAASNRGIDEIRELREKVRLAPMEAAYKVYIIDEVHMLTNEAANALLKTLEEPPEHTVFVLCTTEAEKLPETVVSRCTRIIFKKPTLEEAVETLKRVADGEKIVVDKKALELIAVSAKGSFRDGTKILEQIMLSGKEITENAVREVLGILEVADPNKFIDLLIEDKRSELLSMINELVNQGVNIRNFVERCVEELRERWLKDVQNQKYRQWLVGLEKAYEQTKSSAVVQLPLEIMVVEACGSTPLLRTDEVFPPNLGGKEKGGIARQPSDLDAKWPEILLAVKPMNHSVEGLLRSTRVLNFDGEKLTLEVFYKFHKDKLETEKCKQIVEEAVAKVMGVEKVKLYLKLGDKPKDNGDDLVKAAQEIFAKK